MLRVYSETCSGELLDCRTHAIVGGVIHVLLERGERILIMLAVMGGEEDGSHAVDVQENNGQGCL